MDFSLLSAESRISTFQSTPLNTSLIESRGNFVISCSYFPDNTSKVPTGSVSNSDSPSKSSSSKAKVRIFENKKTQNMDYISADFMLTHPGEEFA
jgi:hypothetical protein